LRHNNGEKNDSEQDYILTPVADNKGQFFDSRKAETSMPQNADANGAYHIALKGLWCMQQINEASDLKKINLAISNKEWLRFVQERTFQK
jgi:CRISPR-associated protein Cpf1